MDNKEIMNKIKENLKSLIKFSSELKESKFSNFDLTDGTKITSPSTELAVDVEVYAIDDKGNQTPLDDGEYVLTDGRTITVKLNKITAIAESGAKEGEKPEDKPADAPVEAEAQKMEDGLPEDHPAESKDEPSNDVESRLKDLEKQIEDILNIISKLGDSQTEVNEQMMHKLAKIADEPGDSPIKSGKKEYSGDYSKTKISASIEELREYIKERQKK